MGIEYKNVIKMFGGTCVVDDLSLKIDDGEFIVLLGPSGCGKTTTLRMLAGLESATSGDIFINGERVNDIPTQHRDLAMVFQSYALYPHMSVFNNIEFPLKAKRKDLDRPDRARRVEQAAKMVRIEHLLDRRPRQLSGGERQRVAIARALVTEPTILLLDEPLSNLDALLRASTRAELKNLQRELGITTVYVTHDQVEAMSLGDRIALLKDGNLVQLGVPQDLYERPANAFVAGFIGSPPMNLIETDGVFVGFRPEAFLPKGVYRDAGELELFQFTVTWIEDLGAERLVYGDVGYPCPHRHVISKISASIPVTVEAGNAYEFAVRKADIRHFDKESGARIYRDSV